MKKARKRYSEMTTTELREATKEFDREITTFPPGRALTPAQKEMFRRARRRGRPKVGEGSANVQITMERGLLRRVDELAREQGLTRSQFIARSVERLMKRAG